MTANGMEEFGADQCSMHGPPTEPTLTPAELQKRMEAGTPMALIDIREHGEYNAAHIPGASSVPRRLIESTLSRLVPTPHIPVVLYDDDGRRAMLAAETVSAMGYGFLDVLTGGINRWASEGGNPFANAKWDEAWKTSTVNDEQWAEIRAGLRDESHRWLQILGSPRDVSAVELSGMIGEIAHVAYHLGAMRQIATSARGPRAGTFA